MKVVSVCAVSKWATLVVVDTKSIHSLVLRAPGLRPLSPRLYMVFASGSESPDHISEMMTGIILSEY